MHYYDYPVMNGTEWWWGLLMMLFWLAFIAFVAIAFMRIMPRISTGMHSHHDPLDIAKERYAKGEITKAEYEQLRDDLRLKTK